MKHGGTDNYWIYTYPTANLWQSQKISPKPTRPTEAAFSSVIHLSALYPGFWRFKQCMQRTASLSNDWNTVAPSSSRAGLKLCGSCSPICLCLLFWVGTSRLNKRHNSAWLLEQRHHVELLTSPAWDPDELPSEPGPELGLQPNLNQPGSSVLLNCFPRLQCLLWQEIPPVPKSCKTEMWSQTTLLGFGSRFEFPSMSESRISIIWPAIDMRSP